MNYKIDERFWYGDFTPKLGFFLSGHLCPMNIICGGCEQNRSFPIHSLFQEVKNTVMSLHFAAKLKVFMAKACFTSGCNYVNNHLYPL